MEKIEQVIEKMDPAIKEKAMSTYFEGILGLYDDARAMVDTIEDERVKNCNTQVALISPFIDQIEESLEIVSEAFLKHCEGGLKPNRELSMKVDSAIRKIVTAQWDFRNKMLDLAEKKEN